MGQRHGRLSNLLSTLKREQNESDQTNELVALSMFHGEAIQSQIDAAETEMEDLLNELSKKHLSQFDLNSYINGLRILHDLHVAMIGRI